MGLLYILIADHYHWSISVGHWYCLDCERPAPRSGGKITVKFTPRYFPTAARESTEKEEQEVSVMIITSSVLYGVICQWITTFVCKIIPIGIDLSVFKYKK